MFETQALNALYRTHKDTLDKVVALEQALKARFYGMDKTVECMMLASLTAEPMVMIGPPGTAKSRLTRTFCDLLGLIGGEEADEGGQGARRDERYFEYLLTQFTEPSELFGYFDLAKLFDPVHREFVRDSSGMIQKAEVVFLDEVFNASSAILNALLTFMNERKFHDRGTVIDVPMKLLFAASNHPPREEGLGAVYDRFLLRSRVCNVSADAETLGDMMAVAWQATHAMLEETDTDFTDLLGRLDTYRLDVDRLTENGALRVEETDPLFHRLADLVTELRRRDLSEMSNRRLAKFAGVMVANALLRSAREAAEEARIGAADLKVILDYGLDAEDDSTVRKLTDHLMGT